MTGAAAAIAACNADWDRYDPRLGASASASTGPTGGTGTTTGGMGGNGGGTTGSGGGAGGAGGSGPWYDDGLSRRRALSIALPPGSDSLADFPVLVRLDPARIDYAATSPGGADLRFVADDHVTLLAHEIERWQPGGESLVWVEAPALAPAPSTVWMYYGGAPAAPALDPAETWSNGFVAVWHLGADLLDASGGAHDGSATGTVAPATGKIGEGRQLDGTEDYVDVGASAAFDALFASGGTLSAFFLADTPGDNGRGRILDRTLDSSIGSGWAMGMTDALVPGSFGFGYAFSNQFGLWTTPADSVTLGAWHHAAASFTEGDAAPVLYLDGAATGVVVDSAPSGVPAVASSIAPRLGGRCNGLDRDFAGRLDEVRVASAVRSPTWSAAEVLAAEDQLVQIGADEVKP